jgi:type IV pilus assembly protein PilX
MTRALEHSYGPTASRGIALIVGLVILAILSMIGVAAFSISTQEERMAGNSRDRMRAFEAAEAALRDCENFVAASGTAVFTGTGGMYQAPADSTTAWLSEKPESWWQTAGKVRQLAGNGSAVAPACIAEHFTVSRGTAPLGTPQIQAGDIAHITAHGYGLNPNTVVRLESYYAM